MENTILAGKVNLELRWVQAALCVTASYKATTRNAALENTFSSMVDVA